MTDDMSDTGSSDAVGGTDPVDGSVPSQQLSENDTSVSANPDADPAQAEWDGLITETGAPLAEPATATGADPAEIPADDDDIPATDVRAGLDQPDTQGADPLLIDIGEDGEGDLSPGDV